MKVIRWQRSLLKISMAKFTHGHRQNTDTNREKDTMVRDRDTNE
jgi:hypothetical protein